MAVEGFISTFFRRWDFGAKVVLLTNPRVAGSMAPSIG